MMSKKRVTIQEDMINHATNEMVRGVKVNVMISPFDIPVSATSNIDDDGIFELKFKYRGGKEEAKEAKGPRKGLTLYVGKHSSRLQRIVIDVKKYAEDSKLADSDEIPFELVFQVDQDIKAYTKSHPKIKSKSFEAVSRVINQYTEDLVMQNSSVSF